MKKKILLFTVSTALLVSLSGCSEKNSSDNQVTTESVSTELTDTEVVDAEDNNVEMVSYTNKGNTYTLNVDNYVSFTETTTHPTSSVNNEDGLEINHGDVYITIQRFPENDSLYMDVDGFYNYLNGDQFSSMVVAENTVIINNSAIVECKNQTIEMKSGNTTFTGYLYYFKTDEGLYKAMISGSDLEVVEHYKNFVDNMTFN